MKILGWTPFLVLALAAGAGAQEAGAPTLTVRASGKVEKAATALQFTFQISAKGDDVAKAAEALEAKQKAALEQLKALGASEKELVLAGPTLEKKDPNAARMMRQVRGANRLKKKKEDEKPEKEPVTVMISVTARVPLKGKTAAELFVESEQLKEKIKAAKLVEKEKKEPGEGDEEDEMNARMMQYQEQQGMEDGFLFQYFAASDPKDTDAALAKAMEAATALAQAGARAAGKTLGIARTLEITETDGAMSQARNYYYQRRGGMPPSTSGNDLVSMTLDGLEVEMAVSVTFGLK